jgi:hypothetical protein
LKQVGSSVVVIFSVTLVVTIVLKHEIFLVAHHNVLVRDR